MRGILRRSARNPIITRDDVPDLPPDVVDVTSVFNPGAVRFGDRDLLMLRVQTRGRETRLMMAESTEGSAFEVRRSVIRWDGLDEVDGDVYHVYDPRITRVDDVYYIMFAADMEDGCRLGVGRTVDFEHFTLHAMGSARHIRNGVIFPERVGGRYLRLDRPNWVKAGGAPETGQEIWMSESEDLIEWRPVGPVMQGRPHYWDELIGSGPPPVRTSEGWMHVYHGVATHFQSVNIYQAGVVLLDPDDPTRVIARSQRNVLEPRETYELIGQVPNVVFPGGMIVRGMEDGGVAHPDFKVDLYYGAADTCVALATTTIGELVAACHD
jgi:beta-1,4-mannooligosaccharide/beta-1,4-mannosyl-N-acetylglucosamine phosphorylase